MEEHMKNPLENPMFQLLCRIGDMILLNLLFVLTSIPVITAGAAFAALHKATQSIVMETETGVWTPFFRAFRENFKQATIVWLGELLIAAALLCYKLLIDAFCAGILASVLNGILLVLALLLVCVAVYVYPLMVRYENALPQILKNAGILAVIKLPRTLAMAAMALFMPVVFYLSVTAFIDTLFFWLLIGFAFVSYLDGVLLKPVFAELERVQEGNGSIGIMN